MHEASQNRMKQLGVLLLLGLLCSALHLLGLLFKKIQNTIGISDVIAGAFIMCSWAALQIMRIFREGQRDETQKLFVVSDKAQSSTELKLD